MPESLEQILNSGERCHEQDSLFKCLYKDQNMSEQAVSEEQDIFKAKSIDIYQNH